MPLFPRYFSRLVRKLRPGSTIGECSRQCSTNANGTTVPRTKYTFLVVIPVTTFGLGTWQVYRHQWKQNLIKELEAKTTTEPVEMTTNLETLETLNYCRVKVVGEFDHTKELYLGPRTYQKNTYGSAEGGYHIITPFKLKDTGERILVNRGWVSQKQRDPENRKKGQIEGPIEMVAVVRNKEKRPPFMLRNDVQKNTWHFRDVDHMAAVANTLPILIDSDAASSVPGGPIGGQTRIVLRNAHLQYIVTWYALSAATMYLLYQLRKRPGAVISQRPK